MPHTPAEAPLSFNSTGACTQTCVLVTEQEEDAPGHAVKAGVDNGDRVCVGSSLDASSAVFTAFTAFVVAVFAPLQVAQ